MIDGLTKLSRSRLSDTVLVDSREGEPRRIGTAVFGRGKEPVFLAQSDHLDWLGYEDRARFLGFAMALYQEGVGGPEASEPS